MREYVPDKWAIIEVTDNVDKVTTKRVLASWYGGYTGSDSWKISSRINKIVDCGAYFEFHNESGSLYRCYKDTYGTSNYTASVYHSLVKDCSVPDSKVSLKYLEDFRG